MSKAFTEITPLSALDCFYIVERHKTQFTYPLHRHKEFELNFIEHAPGVRRIVGDSIETIGEYDLALITGENLEHVWEQGNCESPDIREVTIHFSSELFGPNILNKNQFSGIKTMLRRAEHGLAFSIGSIMSCYTLINELVGEKDSFNQFLICLSILNTLAGSEDARILASSSFAATERNPESRRVQKVKQYINDHYAEPLRLETLAQLAGMASTSFSRFFKDRAGQTLSDYIIDVRLGYAARQLVDTTKNISEICYGCGFNNLSNFNRLFKQYREATPKEFRALYKKKSVKI